MRSACLAITIVIVFTIAIIPIRAQTDPALTAVDDYVSTIWPGLVIAQTDYYNLSGKYFQGLPTHSSIPASGETVYPDLWYGHPVDQQYTWNDLNGLALEAIPASLRIDVYSGPEGAGFVLTAAVNLGGSIYRKSWTYGPETLSNNDWGNR